MRKETRTKLEYACLEMGKFKQKRSKLYPEAFLRRPYQYTKAETKDRTQELMHEKDYLK